MADRDAGSLFRGISFFLPVFLPVGRIFRGNRFYLRLFEIEMFQGKFAAGGVQGLQIGPKRMPDRCHQLR
jgi:hypothetical protein